MASNGAEVGNGYITIKPTLDEGALSEVEAKGSKAGGGFGTAFSVAAGNLISGAVEALGSAVVDTFRNAFDNYANYEQLTGGIETLFKESAAIVQENAANAYKTAGMSANDYMEQVTSFSASLISSLDGDTATAARVADMAMTDMADNANKMGSDIESITNAYQGFAKQNFNMLDNLKLGYGGSRSEMERLLEDAERIKAANGEMVDYSIDSYSDMIEAIHVVQEELGIAGATAEEAAGTISGSLQKLGASWQNFLTGIFDENADLGALGEQLFESIGDVLVNVAPRIGVLVQRIVLGLPDAIISALSMIPSMLEPAITAVFGEQLGGQVTEVLGGVFEGVGETFRQLGGSVVELLQTVYSTVEPVVSMIATAVQSAMPLVKKAIKAVVDFLSTKVIPAVNKVLQTVQPVIQRISSEVQARMPQVQSIIDKAMSFIQRIIDTVWPHVSDSVTKAVDVISTVIDRAWPVISAVIENAMNVISTLMDVAWPAIEAVVTTVMRAVEAVANTVWPAVEGVVVSAVDAIKGAIDGISGIVDVVRGVFDGVKRAIEDPIGAARDFVAGIARDIENAFSWMRIQIPSFSLPHIEWHWNDIAGILTIPVFDGISWYAEGGIVDGAQLIGAGERGAELVWPSYEPYLSRYADAIASRIGGGGRTDELLEALLDKSGDVYLDGKRVGKVVAPFVDAEFAQSGRRLAHV